MLTVLCLVTSSSLEIENFAVRARIGIVHLAHGHMLSANLTFYLSEWIVCWFYNDSGF